MKTFACPAGDRLLGRLIEALEALEMSRQSVDNDREQRWPSPICPDVRSRLSRHDPSVNPRYNFNEAAQCQRSR